MSQTTLSLPSAPPTGSAAVELGSTTCRSLFPLVNRNLNNGSFGMPPISVLHQRFQHTLQIDKEPEAFLRYDAPSMIRSVCGSIASHFLGQPSSTVSSEEGSGVAECLALVDNVGDAFNVCARSLLCNPRFQRAMCWNTTTQQEGGGSPQPRLPKVVVFDRQYPMVLQVLRYHNARSLDALGLYLANEQEAGLVEGAQVLEATPPGIVSGFVQWSVLPLTVELLQDEEKFVAATVEAAMNADALIMDHVCWSPSVVFPARRVCEAIRAREVEEGLHRRRLILLDGAHSVGNVDLTSLFATETCDGNDNANQSLLPFDAFFSNLHKWAMVPRHCAFLYVNPLYHRFVHPNIVSNFYMGSEHGPTLEEDSNNGASHRLSRNVDWGKALVRADPLVTQRMTREFFWCGTRDYATYLTVKDAIAFRATTLGGEGVVQQYVRNVAYEGSKKVAQIWGTELVIAGGPSRMCAMVSVYCPSVVTSEPQLHRILQRLLREKDTFAAWGVLEGRCFVRLSGQVYLTVEDFVYFAEQLLVMAREITD